MSGLNGLELQSRLVDEGYQIPVIFITAFPTSGARQRAMSAGAVAFLSKPFEEESLLQSLQQLSPEPIYYGARLGRVDKSNPDANAGKQHEGREALDEFIVAGGNPA